MYQIILRLIPKKIRNHVYEILALSRMRVHKERFLGVYLITSFFVSLAIALFVFGFFHTNITIGFFSSFIILLLGFYFTFSLKADATAKFVERVLPDALQLMSSNLRAG